MVKARNILLAITATALALALVLIGQHRGETEPRDYLTKNPSGATIVCVSDVEMRERVRTLMLAGLDDALKDQIEHLYKTWLQVYEPDQPKRVTVGVQRALNTYMRSRVGIENWNPPQC